MVKQYEIWIADLNPKIGTESGKIRPVLIIQTNLLNKFHTSTIVIPLTTNIHPNSKKLRIHLKKGIANLKQDCDIMIDQLRAIDNKRFVNKIGTLPPSYIAKVKTEILDILDL